MYICSRTIKKALRDKWDGIMVMYCTIQKVLKPHMPFMRGFNKVGDVHSMEH